MFSKVQISYNLNWRYKKRITLKLDKKASNKTPLPLQMNKKQVFFKFALQILSISSEIISTKVLNVSLVSRLERP
jgi:hypothetical protein